MCKYKNPIIPNSEKKNTADPFVTRYNGYYYHCYSNPQGVFVVKSKTLWDIDRGESKKVYSCTEEGALTGWYAPEMHLIDGKWYIYAAPAYPAKDDLHTMTALVSQNSDPLSDYVNAGIIKGLENKWTIDGTVLYYEDKLYFVWTRCRELFISQMSDPLTLVGETKVIAIPEYDFETIEGDVNEGPAVLYKNDNIYVVYSANDSRCDDYCLGLLTFKKGGDILDPKNWVKDKKPLFTKTDKIFGPGHCSFTTVEENGKEIDYIVYHANLISGSGWTGRSVFIKPFSWDENDRPVFGKPEM